MALRAHLEGPCEQQDGLEGVRHRIFIDFDGILKPDFESFVGIEARSFILFGLVSRLLFVPILVSKFRRLGLLIQVFLRKVLQESTSHANRFLYRGIIL